ncbi:MAG: protein kinase [Planctomycetaceae bacterium]
MGSESERSEFDDVLAEVLRAEAAGEKQDAEYWSAKYPACSDSLREFFANRQELGLTNVFAEVTDMPTIVPGGDSMGSDALAAPGDAIQYFGDYEIEAELARGGMGVVYRAKQTSLGRTVAIKMILAGTLASDDHVARFKTEAEAAARLDHPGIVPIYEIGEHKGQHYFSMAFVAGHSLADRVADGPLPPREAARIVADAAAALQYAHDLDVIHRDLKPANILMDGDRPKVTDFGLAKRLDQQSMTATGEVLGTPGFMSPEQASNAEGAGKPSDVYGLGAILYATLTGRPPFQAANVVETLCQLLETDPPAPRQLNPSVPADLETICMHALRKEPARRYESAAALEADLRRYLEDRPIQARPVSTFEHVWKWAKRRPLIAGLSSALMLSLLVGSAIIGNLWIQERDARVAESVASQKARDSAKDAVSSRNAAIDAKNDAIKSRNEALAAKKDAVEQTKIAEQNLVTSTLSLADLMYANGDAGLAEVRYKEQYRAAVERNDGDRRAWWRLWRTYIEYPVEQRLPVSGTSLTSSADGKWVAIASGDTLSVLDGDTYELRHTFKSSVGAMWRAEFSSTGRYLVANHTDGSCLLQWDMQQPKTAPAKLELENVELSGVMKAMIAAASDPSVAEAARQLANSKPGFGFAGDKVLVASTQRLWEFDLEKPGNPPVKLAQRKRSATPGSTPSVVLARLKNRLWVTDFGSLLGTPLTIVDLGEDEGATKIAYVGVDGDSLVDIQPPRNSSRFLGLPDFVGSLPAAQRAMLVDTNRFALHAPSLTLALIHDDELSTWDLRTSKRTGVLKLRDQYSVGPQESWSESRHLRFSHDGKQLAVFGEVIRMVDVGAMAVVKKFNWFHDKRFSLSTLGGYSNVCFARGDTRLLSCTSESGGARGLSVYALDSGSYSVLPGPSSPRLTSDGTIYTIDRMTTASLLTWDPPSLKVYRDGVERKIPIPRRAKMKVTGVGSPSADGKRFVLGGPPAKANEGGSRLICVETESGEVSEPHVLANTPDGLSTSPDGNYVSLIDGGEIRFLSLPGFKVVDSVSLLSEAQTDENWAATTPVVAWSSDSRRVAVVFQPLQRDPKTGAMLDVKKQEVAIVDVEQATIVARRECPRRVLGGLFVGDDSELALYCSQQGHAFQFFSATDLANKGEWDLGMVEIGAMAESKTRRVLACGNVEGRLMFWDSVRREPLVDVNLFDDRIGNMEFVGEDEPTLRLTVGVKVIDLDLERSTELVTRHLEAAK